ncbi:MAG: zinc-dependent metalloprotease [Planctomycetaceae bacterium]|jgi:hypothetical protein|nr:zinc-dependent metalloprotease [Planctomycetaceae bacterium]
MAGTVSFAQDSAPKQETPKQETAAADSAAPSNEALILSAATTGSSEKSSGDSEKDTPRPIKEVLPDAKKIDGMIPMYLKKDRLYAEITGSNTNTDYLISAAIAKGSGTYAISGFTLDDSLWQFRKVNDKIQVVSRNIRFKAESGTPEATAVENAYSDSIIYSLPIVARGENGGDVIDMGTIFMSDFAGIGGSFARDRSNWGAVKGFKNNMEFEVEATYSVGRYSAASDSSAVGVTIHYSISKLPSSGYSPRPADNRIGYFTTTHKNFSINREDNHMVRYINRWNLQKADPSAPFSPPKKPIIFWIEKTVPFKYRNAVREGILEWNKAFEKLGYVNAIEVRQQSDADTWDPEDINYNTFRWITSDAGFAMGPSRVNPLTGEILDADIIMDAGFVDSWRKSFDIFLAEKLPAVTGQTSRRDQIRSLLGIREDMKKPEEHEHEHEHNDSMNHGICTYSRDKANEMAFASLVLAFVDGEEGDGGESKDEEKPKEEEKKEESKPEEAKDGDKPNGEKSGEKKEEEKKDESKEEEKKEDKKLSKEELQKKADAAFEKLVLEGIKDVVMHEVGHTLGLRHNFKASSWLTLDEINDPNRSKEYGIAGSVMDYLPVNIVPKGKHQGDYFMSTLGPYDYLAIEYGYTSEGSEKALKKIASKQAEKGYAYATDEDARSSANPDPLTGLRDLGSNPIDYAKYAAELYLQLLPEVVDRATQEGRNYRDVGYSFRVILFRKIIACEMLARNVSGLYINRDFKGDPGNRPPVQVVPAKTQRESVEYICQEIFGTDSLRVPAELYNQFGNERWLEGGSAMQSGGQTGLRNVILDAQLGVLASLIDPSVLDRLDDTQLRVKEGEDVYTMNELFDSLTAAVFRELDAPLEGEFTAAKPAIHISRRNLQEYYFLFLSEYAMGELSTFYSVPESCQSTAAGQLENIAANIKSTLGGKAKLDSASRSHLQNLERRIKDVLNSELLRTAP